MFESIDPAFGLPLTAALWVVFFFVTRSERVARRRARQLSKDINS